MNFWKICVENITRGNATLDGLHEESVSHAEVALESKELLETILEKHTANSAVIAESRDLLTTISEKDAGLVKSSSSSITNITAAAFATAQAQVGAANQCVLLAASNANRKGFAIYNNSTNSMYVQTSTDTSSQIGQCASNAGPTAHFYSGQLGNLIYTGPLYGRRNSGTGGAWCVEFL